MMADLCIHFPVVRRLFDTADRIARDVGEELSPQRASLRKRGYARREALVAGDGGERRPERRSGPCISS